MEVLSVVVWGATGITGKRVCHELAVRYTGVVSWGIAGRNRKRLNSLKKVLISLNKQCTDIPLLVANIADRESVEAMVKQAQIVISCAGPFRKYSDVVVETCVKEGTHYVDVTGDIVWVRSLIDRFHEEAAKNKTKIVPFCGMESLPCDIGCFFMSDYVRKRYGRGVSRILCAPKIKVCKNPSSRGSLDSILGEFYFTAEEKEIRIDPQALTPPDKRLLRLNQSLFYAWKLRVDTVWPDVCQIHYEKDFGLWTGPWLAQTVDTRVIRRTNALLDVPYGKDFDCAVRTCSARWITAFRNSLPAKFFDCLMTSPSLFNMLCKLRLLPKPGEGPSIEDEKNNWWRTQIYAIVEQEDELKSKIIVKGTLSDDVGGYTSTARQVVECAMCQVLEGDRLEQLGMADGGVITPASAFGNVLVDRLSAIGIKIQIDGTDSSKL